jgi:hypothetical protein
MGLLSLQKSRALRRHTSDDSPLSSDNGNSGGVLVVQDLLSAIRRIVREELGAAVENAVKQALAANPQAEPACKIKVAIARVLYNRARRGADNSVEADDVAATQREDYRRLRRGDHTELATDSGGVREQNKKGRGY